MDSYVDTTLRDFMRPCSVWGEYAHAEKAETKRSQRSKMARENPYVFWEQDIVIAGVHCQLEKVQLSAFRLHFYLNDLSKIKR